MSLKEFEVVTLFVGNIAAARAFYETIFKVDTIYFDDVSAVFGFSGVMINLLHSDQAPDLVAPLAVGSEGVRMLLTIRVDDVDVECTRLTGLGVELLNGPTNRPWGRRTAAFADPDGHVWELAQVI